MMLGCVIVGMAASIASAVCAAVCMAVCVRLLHREEAAVPEMAEPEPEDTALREGILNLMRYAPGGREKEEE